MIICFSYAECHSLAQGRFWGHIFAILFVICFILFTQHWELSLSLLENYFQN